MPDPRDLAYRMAFPMPRRLARRRTALDPAQRSAFEARLFEVRSVGRTAAHMEGPLGKKDLEDHLWIRLRAARRRIVPWLDAARPLDGARILEIGCGSGSSTVALAEQGAVVEAVDIVAEDLEVTELRCRAHGVEARTHLVNAVDAAEAFASQRFDHVVFYASLEHMTPDERLTAIRTTWDLVDAGGCWSVVEAPNRLWHYDRHTSLLPFYNWLPDELAMQYARFSPRQQFREAEFDVADLEPLYRWGRGVSYHEFDLAIGEAADLQVASSMRDFERRRNPALWAAWSGSKERAFRALLNDQRPDLHPGWFEPSLHLALRR